MNADFQRLFLTNRAQPDFVTSYVYRSATAPVYMKREVEDRLNGLTPGASVVFLLNGFDSGVVDASEWGQYARSRAVMTIYIAIRMSMQMAQGAPHGVWSTPIPGYGYVWTIAKLNDIIGNVETEAGDLKATRCQHIRSLWNTAPTGRVKQRRPHTDIQHDRNGFGRGSQSSSYASTPNLEAYTHLIHDF